jgi:hypothetical protein
MVKGEAGVCRLVGSVQLNNSSIFHVLTSSCFTLSRIWLKKLQRIKFLESLAAVVAGMAPLRGLERAAAVIVALQVPSVKEVSDKEAMAITAITEGLLAPSTEAEETTNLTGRKF